MKNIEIQKDIFDCCMMQNLSKHVHKNGKEQDQMHNSSSNIHYLDQKIGFQACLEF